MAQHQRVAVEHAAQHVAAGAWSGKDDEAQRADLSFGVARMHMRATDPAVSRSREQIGRSLRRRISLKFCGDEGDEVTAATSPCSASRAPEVRAHAAARAVTNFGIKSAH